MKHRIVSALAGFLVLSFVCRATAEDYEHYTRYVESDGKQEIDLGFKLSSDMTIECVYEQLNQQTTTYQALFGARTDASTGDISFFSYVNSTHFTGGCQTGGGDSYKIYRNRFQVLPATSFAQRRYLVKRTPTEGWTLTDLETGLNVPKLLNDGQAQGQTWNGETFSTANNIKLFTIDGVSIDGSTWGRASMRLYLLRVSDSSGKVLHEIIPDQEGDRIGVRDTVTGNYLYPTGDDPLKIGDTKSLSVQIDPSEPMPPGDYDVALDCLISDGSQWIETGVTLDSEMTIDIDCAPLGFGQNEMGGVFGARSDVACSNISVLVTENGFAYVDFNDAACIGGDRETWAVRPGTVSELSNGVRYNFHLSMTERSITNLETGKRLGINKTPWNNHLFSTESTAQIFGIAGRTGAHAKMKLYRVKIANNEGVLHNYFPVRKGGVAGLYDCVTGNFLMNAGEGEFDYTCEETPLINEGALKSFVTAQVPWQDTTTVTTVMRPINVGSSQSYVESDGTQEIDLGFKLKSDMNIEVVFAGVGTVSASQGFFGARGNDASDRNIALFRGQQVDGKYVSADCQNGAYATYRMNNASVGTGVVYRATLKGGEWTLTNETSGAQIDKSPNAWKGTTFETPVNAMLFKINNTTIDGTTWARATVRIYSVVVRDKDGTLLHDLVPSVNEACVVGLFDRAAVDAASAWKLPKSGAGVNPLKLVSMRIAPSAPHAYTNVVGRVDDSCKLPVTMSPLRPGTAYEWFAFAEDQRGDFVSSPTTNTFTTVADAVPAGAKLSLKVEVLFGMAKAGRLRLRLTRTDTANAAAVTLVAGKDYGGANPANWRNVMACGSFAAGEAAIVVDTPFLPKDTNYLRAFTADGEWSETVLIPETDFVPGKQGLAVIVR